MLGAAAAVPASAAEGGYPDGSEVTTPDGHAEVLLLNSNSPGSSLQVLTDLGVITLISDGFDTQGLFTGRVDTATWQDVDGDGWPDVQVTGDACGENGGYENGGCRPSSFTFLQRHDRTFVVGASLQLAKTEIDLGDAVRVRVRINSVAHRPAPTGTVSFTIDGFPVGAPLAVHNGRAVGSVVPPNPGQQAVVAHYSGDAAHPAFDSEPALIRVFAPTALSLVGADLPTVASATWTGEVQLTSTPPYYVPGETAFRFVLDGVDQGGVLVDGDSRAAFSFSGLAPGKHRLVAVYAGGEVGSGHDEGLLRPSSLTVRHRVLPG